VLDRPGGRQAGRLWQKHRDSLAARNRQTQQQDDEEEVFYDAAEDDGELRQAWQP
jgi:hypothetical protein